MHGHKKKLSRNNFFTVAATGINLVVLSQYSEIKKKLEIYIKIYYDITYLSSRKNF
jgi:hypothetical protein